MNRRDLLLTLAATPLWNAVHTAAAADTRAIVDDADGTRFDVHSVVALANEMFPGQGDALSQRWRAKQLEYSWTLSLMGRYEDFWSRTDHALGFACNALELNCSAA